MPITLAITEAGDGSHGTATIAGLAVDTDWTIVSQEIGSNTWADLATGTGPDSVAVTFPNPGSYWCYLAHNEGGTPAIASLIRVVIVDPALPVSQQIAAAVTAAINGYAFALPFTAERAYIPNFKLEQLADLRVTVCCRASDSVQADRSTNFEDYTIEIGLQQRLSIAQDKEPAVYAANQIAAIDPLMKLVQAIGDFLSEDAQKRMGPGQRVTDSSNPLYDWMELLENRVFVGLIEVTYKVRR
jgi:hypothetical protein